MRFDQENKRLLLFFATALLLLGLWLRYSCVWFAYPLTVNWDEERLLGNVFRMLHFGSFNPQFFNYPSLVLYLNGALFWLLGTKLAVVDYFVAGRLLTVSMALVTMVLLTYLAWRYFSPTVGVLSLLFISTSFMHVRFTTVIRVDPYVALWALCAYGAALALHKQGPRLSYYIVGGLFVGLATSSKYTAFLTCLPIVVAHVALYLQGRTSLFAKGIFIAGLCSLIAFFVTTPFAILDNANFMEALRFEANHYAKGHPGCEAAGATSFGLYLSWLFNTGFGVLPSLLALVGLCTLFKRDKTMALLAASFPVALLLFVGQHRVYFPRNVVGMVPFLAIFAALGTKQLFEMAQAKMERRFAYVSVAALLLLSVSSTTIRSFEYRRSCNLPDTRWVASCWLRNRLPKAATIGREQYTPPIEKMTKRYNVQPLGLMGIGRNPAAAVKMDYLILSSQDHMRVLKDPKKFAQEASVYRSIFAQGTLLARFEPKDGKYSGPVISVYQL